MMDGLARRITGQCTWRARPLLKEALICTVPSTKLRLIGGAPQTGSPAGDGQDVRRQQSMDQRLEVSIEYPGGVTDQSAVVTRVGPGRFRLEQDPLSCLMAERPRDLKRLPNYGDIIEAEEIAPNTLRFAKVAERAPLKRFQFIISQDLIESPGLATILSKVTALQGHWERIFGGILIVYLPEESEYDVSRDLATLCGDAT